MRIKLQSLNYYIIYIGFIIERLSIAPSKLNICEKKIFEQDLSSKMDDFFSSPYIFSRPRIATNSLDCSLRCNLSLFVLERGWQQQQQQQLQYIRISRRKVRTSSRKVETPVCGKKKKNGRGSPWHEQAQGKDCTEKIVLVVAC